MKRSSKDGNAASLIRDSQFDETDRLPEYAALLKHAQQPGLKPCLELANFVEKQHAAIGRRIKPLRLRSAPVTRPGGARKVRSLQGLG